MALGEAWGTAYRAALEASRGQLGGQPCRQPGGGLGPWGTTRGDCRGNSLGDGLEGHLGDVLRGSLEDNRR